MMVKFRIYTYGLLKDNVVITISGNKDLVMELLNVLQNYAKENSLRLE